MTTCCFIVVFALTVALLSNSANCAQWCANSEADVAQGFTNGTCFDYFTSEMLPRDQAAAQCGSMYPGVTGDLAKIPSQFAQMTLYQNLLSSMSTPASLWIDAKGYTSAEWRWADRTPLDPQQFTNWIDGQQPDDSSSFGKYCAYVDISDPFLQWRVDNCGAQKQFICEYKSSAEQRRIGEQFVPLSYVLDWYSAKVECEREGGVLLDMSSSEMLSTWLTITNEMATTAGGVENLPGKGAIWLGLSRQIWLWESTGDEIGWYNFSSASLATEAVQECVYVSTNLNWVATTCSSQFGYLCQFDKSPDDVTTTTTSEPETTVTETSQPSTGEMSSTIDQQVASSSTAAETTSTTTTTESVPTPIAVSTMPKSYVIAIIVITIVCFIVIVFAIALACCGHLWMPGRRRHIAGTTAKTADIAISAHPSSANQAVATSRSASTVAPNQHPVVPIIRIENVNTAFDGFVDSDDSSSLPQSQHSNEPQNFALTEAPNEIPEIYTTPTFLYSFPSQRPLEPASPGRMIDEGSSSSSNVSRSASSTTSVKNKPWPPSVSSGSAPTPPSPYYPPSMSENSERGVDV